MRPAMNQGLTPCLVVIPARNEAGTIGAVVRSAAAQPGVSRVLVVCDASTDGTAIAARHAGALVMRLASQLGAWGATQAGLRYAQRAGFERVATLDADGQHDPAHLNALMAQLGDGPGVLIGTFPQRLSVAKRMAWRWFRALTGLGIEDLTSGYRIYGRDAIALLTGPEATLLDYQDVGVLLLLRKHGITVSEMPISMTDRRSGGSRVFSSWWMVARYMAQTTVLCLANLGRLQPRLSLPAVAKETQP